MSGKSLHSTRKRSRPGRTRNRLCIGRRIRSRIRSRLCSLCRRIELPLQYTKTGRSQSRAGGLINGLVFVEKRRMDGARLTNPQNNSLLRPTRSIILALKKLPTADHASYIPSRKIDRHPVTPSASYRITLSRVRRPDFLELSYSTYLICNNDEYSRALQQTPIFWTAKPYIMTLKITEGTYGVKIAITNRLRMDGCFNPAIIVRFSAFSN